jgi:OmpA-OmpF porin, OOP family
MKILLRSFCIVFLLLGINTAYSQQVHQRWEVGGGLGLSGYLGDLNKSDFFSKEPKGSGGVFGRYHFNRSWALRGALTFGTLSGNDANFDDRKVRGFTTRSPLTDLSAIVEYDFLGKQRFKYDATAFQVRFKRKLSPYLFTGAGVGFTNPKPNFTGTASTPAIYRQGAVVDQAANYSKSNFVIPFGVGVRYDLAEHWVLGAEAGFRLAFSDYLDGVSQGANPGRDDRYKLSTVSIAYRFDKKDTDRDGIPDEKDACPKEPGSVKMNGCPDKDNDGVADKDDDCPETFGLASLKGCPDTDGDGIRDKDDTCPDEAGLVALQGCPDRDKDGIADKDDVCPDIAGLPTLKGCPDTDKDGIADKDDTCPDVAGLAQFGGCPDTDGDGITDKEDVCPTVAGKLDLKGCPDTDGDGIADKDDACPAVAGVAMFAGCPDTDADSVEDAKDRCPMVAGKPEFEGCPDAKTLKAIIKVEEKKAREEAELAKKLQLDAKKAVLDFKVESVLFESNSAVIQLQYQSVLDEVANVMAKNPDYKLQLLGHTDSKGTKEHNQKLSEERAKACLEYLQSRGVTTSRISLRGFGDILPAADNQTEAGRQRNRRVEVKAFRQ